MSDLPEAIELVWRVFHEFEAPDFSEEGVNEFKGGLELSTMQDKLINCAWIMWGCFKEDRLAGMIAMRQPFHISLLFVDKEFHRQGIARALMNSAVKEYVDEGFVQAEAANTVTVNSSPYAVEIYKRLGFEPTDTEQLIKGIRFTPMAKKPA